MTFLPLSQLMRKRLTLDDFPFYNNSSKLNKSLLPGPQYQKSCMLHLCYVQPAYKYNCVRFPGQYNI